MVARPRRWSRVAGYAAVAAAGGLAAASPSATVRAAMGLLVYLWPGFLVIGGLLSAWGSWTDRWIGEYAGLPLLIVGLAAYVVVLAATGRWQSIAGALFLAGFACLLWARARDVGLLREEATRAARQRHGEA